MGPARATAAGCSPWTAWPADAGARRARGQIDEMTGRLAERMRDGSIELFLDGTIDFDELAHDIASEVRTVHVLNDEIARIEDRIDNLYSRVDPAGIVRSGPGIGTTLAAAILGQMGDPNRFGNLAAVRAYTGLVPGVD